MLANGIYGHADDAMMLERQENGGKDSIIPIFFREKSLDKKRSEVEKRNVYNEFDCVRMVVPGDKTTEHVEQVNEGHKRRWREQWQAYQEGKEQINGLRLEDWYATANHPALIEELRGVKVRTVLDLANLNDDFAGRFPGGYDWRTKAREQLEKDKGLEAAVTQNAAMVEQMAAMQKKIEELSAAQRAPMPEAVVEYRKPKPKPKAKQHPKTAVNSAAAG